MHRFVTIIERDDQASVAVKDDTSNQIIDDLLAVLLNGNVEVRDISGGTGVPVATVHRYLLAMSECGELAYDGRKSVSTQRMRMEASHASMPVLGYVACGEGQEEEEQIIEYIRMPETLVGNGNFFALIAKGESMIDVGVHPGDYVVVNKDKQPKLGDIVVALLGGKNNLKVLGYNEKKKQYVLQSRNPDKKTYADIPVEDELRIQGVAVCVTHKF